MTALVAVISVVAGIALAAVLGNPIAALVPIILGGIIAIRLGYRNQARSIDAATRYRADGTPTTTTTPAPTRDFGEQLRVLKGLLDEGIISQEEYDAKKADLLARM